MLKTVHFSNMLSFYPNWSNATLFELMSWLNTSMLMKILDSLSVFRFKYIHCVFNIIVTFENIFIVFLR